MSAGKGARKIFSLFKNRGDRQAGARAIEAADFVSYQRAVMHRWLRTLTALAVALVPLFFALDVFMLPPAFLPRFAVYRALSTALALLQALLVWSTKPSRLSYVHGYFLSFQIGLMISLMTNQLGGFASSYYAGLNLVIIGVNLLMPWKAYHTLVNAALILAMYAAVNLAFPRAFEAAEALNNIFFLAATSVIAMSINYVRYRLIREEFNLLTELKNAKDALWSEIELAKKIQTALLPRFKKLTGYQVAAAMLPAREVGGDYYDIIETDSGERWVAVGDVAGHGVDAGLIMMMAQTSIITLIKGNHTLGLKDILNGTNRALREDILRLGANHYMTIMLLRLEDRAIAMAGKHQDLLLFHAVDGRAEALETKGTWLGIADEIRDSLEVKTVGIDEGDAILLFTDGVTEGANGRGELYGQERLLDVFRQHARLPVTEALELILKDVLSFQEEQADDISLIVLKKDGARPA